MPDVAPYEHMKIRILNGGHAAIAYPAALLDIHFVPEAIEEPLIRAFLSKLEHDEIIPVIPPVPNTNLGDYYKLIETRFSNPKIGDTIPRLAQDGSNRQPKFILPSTADRLARGKDVAVFRSFRRFGAATLPALPTAARPSPSTTQTSNASALRRSRRRPIRMRSSNSRIFSVMLLLPMFSDSGLPRPCIRSSLKELALRSNTI